MNLLPPTCVLGSAFTWAVASARYSSISKEYSVFTLNFARALVALPLFIVSAFVVSGGVAPGLLSYQSLHAFHFEWLGLSMIASFGLGDAAFFLSTRFLGLSSALAISSCYPVWTLLLSSLFLEEAITLTQAGGMGIILLGLIIVLLNNTKKADPTHSLSQKKWAPYLGLFLAIVASLLWSLNGFAISKGGIGITAPVGNTVRMFMALFLTASLGRAFSPKSPIVLPVAVLKRFLWIFVLEAFVGSYLYLYGISQSPLAVGAMLSCLSPVIAVPIAVFFGLERFSVLRTLGVCLAVAGVALLIG